jgi:methylenetetrahydrofolate dehydrogenase (NADP+)/methenyltetrahydrofolate cyclohydrolase
MTTYFDGKRVASEKLEALKIEVEKLKQKGVTPKLVSIMVGEDEGSELYLSLKKRAAEEVGVELEIKKLASKTSMNRFIEVIENLNEDRSIQGIMIQLPLPKNFRNKTKDLINEIDPKKDVDGMRRDSEFLAPVVGAVEFVFVGCEEYIHHNDLPFKVVVVGGQGFVGRKIIKRLFEYNSRIYRPVSVDIKTKDWQKKVKEADVLISATGSTGLIKKSMVKDIPVLIDVGSPKGDIERQAYDEAYFVSPVPGGVGPMTIYYLLENLVEVASS